MARYGMAINLNTCVGCGACGLSCKTENNTEYQQGGTKYNWADFLTFTTGVFPDVKYTVIPVLCNHCTNAPCVEICPVDPKAMYKTADGITMHNDERCIGCRMCQNACPYSAKNVITSNVQYSVLSYNPDTGEPTHAFWADTSAVIPSGTATPSETAIAAGSTPPYKNSYTHSDYNAVRPSNVTEKCIFCDHRLQNGEEPYCVVSCPTGARVFGDLDDPGSEISLLIANGYKRLANNSGEWLNEAGTSPNVYYVGDFNGNLGIDENENKTLRQLKIYPNPALSYATAEFDLEFSGTTSILIYNTMGQLVKNILTNESRFSGKNNVKLDVSDLKAGTYICSVKTNKEVLSATFIVK